jgi:DNA polymerase-3 subunit alpha
VRVKKLPGCARDAGMPAVAVTDTNNMFCALEFSVLAAARPGCSRSWAARSIWPTSRAVRRGSSRTLTRPLVLLAQNERGLAQPDEAELLPLPAGATGRCRM